MIARYMITIECDSAYRAIFTFIKNGIKIAIVIFLQCHILLSAKYWKLALKAALEKNLMTQL